MEATTSRTQVSPEPAELARDLYAFVVHLHKSADADRLETVAQLELSTTQLKALRVLDAPDVDELSLGALAERLRISLAATSRTVEALHQRACVERREDPADRRMKRVRITNEGRDVIRQLHAAKMSALEEFAATLSPLERRRLAAALSPVLERSELVACRFQGTDP